MKNIFKVWDSNNKIWSNDLFFINNLGILCYQNVSGKVSIAKKDFLIVNGTDLKDYWVEKGEEPKTIFEGDYVYLHNWGIDNNDMVVGVAKVVWDEEYHQWDFKMIAGERVEDSYDKFRQSPMVVGNIYENKDFEYSKNWVDFLKIEVERINLKYEKKLLDKEKKLIKEEELKFSEKLDALNKKKDEIKKKEDSLKEKLKGVSI